MEMGLAAESFDESWFLINLDLGCHGCDEAILSLLQSTDKASECNITNVT